LLINRRFCFFVFLCALLLLAAGCRSAGTAGRPGAPPGAAIDDTAEIDEPVERRVTEPESRIRAARDLNRRAADLLDGQMPDDAIDLLERSIAIDPANGEAYYYLSRAWQMKGDRGQALEFIRLAEIYTGDNDNWHPKVMEQKAHIQDEK